MEDIVYEIIGGALILGIILVVIMVFRNGTQAVKEAANSQMQNDIKIEQTVGVDGAVYGSSKIQEAMAYAQVAEVHTQVIIEDHGSWEPLCDGRTKTGIGNAFDPAAVAFSGRYTLDIQYYDTKLNISTKSSPSNLLNDSNRQGAVLVRFLFTEK